MTYEDLAESARPKLERALVGAVGFDRAQEGAAEALAWAWENFEQVETMENPIGYLYRVARSAVRIRRRERIRFLIEERSRIPDVEPGLLPALKGLPEKQRVAVWLVHACGWRQVEVAEALDISPSAVSTHVKRALDALRKELGEAR